MENENVAQEITIPDYLAKAFEIEMQRTLNLPWRETLSWIQRYLQNEYDNLENKDGKVVVNFPTLEQLREYILKETK